MISTIDKDEKTIEIQHYIDSNSFDEIKIEIKVPSINNIDSKIKKDQLNECIKINSRFHKGKNNNLLHSYIRALKNKKISKDKYILYSKIFSFLFIRELNYAKKKDINELMISIFHEILKEYRESVNNHNDYITDSHNKLLAFEYEQYLIFCLQKSRNEETTKKINELLENEKQFHDQIENYPYSIEKICDNPERILNQIEIKKKSLKIPMRINTEQYNKDTIEKYLSISLSTLVIMMIFIFIIMQMRMMGFEDNLNFIFAFAGIYVARDIFKESIRDWFYSIFTQKKPNLKFKNRSPDGEYISEDEVWISAENKTENHKRRSVLTILKKSKTFKFKYNDFKKIKSNLEIDLSILLKQYHKDNREFYSITKKSNIKKSSINCTNKGEISITTTRKGEINSENFKFIFNRNKIINIEKIEK